MHNKIVIITGAEGNLGQAAVKIFNDNGAKVAAVCYGKNPSPECANLSINDCNLTNPETAEKVITQVTEELGQPSILINIAGGFMWKEIKDTNFTDFEAMFNLNFKTMYNMTTAALPILERTENARIINIGALGAVSAGVGMAAYAVSKAAVMRFTEALAAETGDNMTVNAIMPSIIDTPQNRNDMPDADFSKWVTTEELVDLMVFLSSNEGSGINGALLPATGRV